MVRATLWTVGLFGAGTALCRAFPSTWTEPIVLLVLGLAFLFISARTGVVAEPSAAEREARPAAAAVTPAPAPQPVPVARIPTPAPTPLPVERTV